MLELLYCTSWSSGSEQLSLVLKPLRFLVIRPDISKCLTLVVEQTNRISLASFSDLQCHARDQLCCLSGVVFKKLHDQAISKCLYNLFVAVERTPRIILAGFSDLQCVVYVIITFLK